MHGALLIGDTAGLLNVPKSKGTNHAIRSGMLAAEHLASSLSAEGFEAKLRASDAMAELRKVRNIKPGFKKGLWFGQFNAGWETVSGGLSPCALTVPPDWASLHTLRAPDEPRRDYRHSNLAPRT